MAIPEGMSCVSPGRSSSGAAMHARRSTPAEPLVAYWGKGYSLPMRGSRIRICKRRSAGMGRSRVAVVEVALRVALGNELDQLPCQRSFVGERQLTAPALPE